MLMVALQYHWKLRKLKLKKAALYNEKGATLAKAYNDKRSDNEIEEIIQDSIIYMTQVEQEIKIASSDYLIQQAERYLVPIPEWGELEAAFNGHRYLGMEAYTNVRNAIREEKKARREEILAWLVPLSAALTGIGGTIIGILSLIKK
jgi:hypothetical protein